MDIDLYIDILYTDLYMSVYVCIYLCVYVCVYIWKQPKCPLKNEGIKNMWCTYTSWNVIRHKKEGNSAIYNNMDGPWGNYTKWNKPDRERQIPHDLTYMWSLKMSNS